MTNQINFLSWNIRGINNSVALRNLRDQVKSNKVGIFCLQETKSENCPFYRMRSFFDMDRVDMLFQISEGFSGGMITGWDKKLVKCVALAKSSNWIWTCFASKGDDMKFHVVNVYSPQSLDKKRVLWNSLRNIIECVQGEKICFIGDFNCVRDVSERLNCVYRDKETEEFNELIMDCNLAEVHIVNSSYTWFGPENRKSKLDRVLVNSNWLQLGNWQVKALNKKHSDHKPILLYCQSLVSSPKPFKVFNCYLTESLLDEVKKTSIENQQWRGESLHHVLKEIKGIVKRNSSNSRSQLDNNITILEQEIDNMDNFGSDGEKYRESRAKLLLLYK